MSSNTTTVAYPTFGAAGPGTLHLRSYETDMSQSRAADIAAVIVERHAAHQGHGLVVACAVETDLPRLVGTVGLGWREPGISYHLVSNLLDLTAELYCAWRADADQIDMVIDNIQRLRTGWESGHDDQLVVAWLDAARTANIGRLGKLTGLDYAAFTKADVPTDPARPTLWAGTQRRKGMNGASRIMGTATLMHSADSIVDVANVTSCRDDILADVKVQKHRHGFAGTQVRVTRPLVDGGAWQQAA